MSLRPVEQQTLINRGNETSRLQGARDSQDLHGGQQFHDQFRQEVARRPQQVSQPHQAEQGKVSADGRGGGQNEQEQRRGRRKTPENERPLAEPGKGSRLDIRA